MERNLPRNSKRVANESLGVSLPDDCLIIPRGDVSDESDIEDDGGNEKNITSSSSSSSDNEDVDNENEDRVYRWRRRSNGHFPVPFSSSEDVPHIPEIPYFQFKTYFDDDMFEYIADQTNLYSVLKSGTSIDTNGLEIEQLFSIWMYMGVFSSPSYRDYWNNRTRWPCIADIMPVNRYEKLMQYFHLCDIKGQKPGDPGYDPLFKVRKMFDAVRNKCRSEPQEEFQSIDEQIIPFKGRHINKQYLPAKPHRYGFKMITRGSSSGLIYDFVMYAGKHTELIEPKPNMSTTANCVRTLCFSIPGSVQNTKIFMDNFYITLDLMMHLKQQFSIQTTGTVRSNRLHGCPLLSEKELKAQGRGAFDQMVDANSNLTIVRWLDNRAVTLASTFLEAKPLTTVKRWDAKAKTRVEVSRPNIVGVYNIHMGGIDLSDMLLTMYQNQRKSRKWYFRVIYYLIWTALSNCWLLYRKSLQKEDDIPGNRLSFKDFLLQVAEGLSKVGKVCKNRPGRPSRAPEQTLKRLRASDENIPLEILRKDHIDHLPKHSEKGRCKNCKTGFSRWTCKKCRVHLCLNDKNNCFTNYHL